MINLDTLRGILTAIPLMIALTTIWSLMWKVATAEEMILEKVGKWGEKMVDKGYKIFSGLIVCQWCVPNIHGILFVYPLAFALGIFPLEFNWKYILIYPFTMGGACFLTGIIWEYYLTQNKKRDYYEQGARKFYYETNELTGGEPSGDS